MLENNAPDSSTVAPRRSRQYEPKRRLKTVAALDQRTKAARRIAMLVRTWTDALGGRLTNGRRIAVENAAALLALSEHAKVARLSGDTSISLNDVARLENAAARAVRELDLPNGGDPERESVDSWSLK